MEYISQEYCCAMCNQYPKRKMVYPCGGGHNLCEKCKITCGRKCFCGLLFNTSPVYLEDILLSYVRPGTPNVPTTELVYKKKSSSKCSSSRSTQNEECVMYESMPQGSQTNYQSNIKQSESSGTLQGRHSPKYINVNETNSRCNKIQATTSNVQTSRRPIQCPNSDCEKVVALSSLILHFSFDHPKIVQRTLYFGEVKIVPININDIQYGKGSCIALMLLSQKGQTPISSSSQDVAYPILGARIRCQTPYTPEQNDVISPRNNKPLNSNFDIVIVWLSGVVDSDNINCNLEFCNPSKGLSIAYCGQIVSLREDNDPYSIFTKSDCLVMNASAFEKSSIDEQAEDDRHLCKLKVCLTKVAENLNLF